MKESEFYQRAMNDVAFRRQKLEDFRYLKLIGAGLAWIAVALTAVLTLRGGLNSGAWDRGLGMMSGTIFIFMNYALLSTRLGALEAIEQSSVDATAQSRPASATGSRAD